jgi:site-specific recombinase XerC
VQTRVALWARIQGIATHVHPHMFRHACATHVLESSGSIREVQVEERSAPHARDCSDAHSRRSRLL